MKRIEPNMVKTPKTFEPVEGSEFVVKVKEWDEYQNGWDTDVITKINEIVDWINDHKD
jgi:hypothetical protein